MNGMSNAHPLVDELASETILDAVVAGLTIFALDALLPEPGRACFDLIVEKLDELGLGVL